MPSPALVTLLVVGAGRVLLAAAARRQLQEACGSLARVLADAEERCRQLGERCLDRCRHDLARAARRHRRALRAAHAKAQARLTAAKTRRKEEAPPLKEGYRQTKIEGQRHRSEELAAATERHARRRAKSWPAMKAKRAARVTRARRLAEIESTSSSGWQALARDWREGMEAAKAEAAALTAAGAASSPRGTILPGRCGSRRRIRPNCSSSVPTTCISPTCPAACRRTRGCGLSRRKSSRCRRVRAFPDSAALLLTAEGEGRDEAVAVVRDALFRLLTMMPAGKVRFTILDPVGLGQNFAAFMDLADHDEALVNSPHLDGGGATSSSGWPT